MADETIMSREACQVLAERVRRLARGPGSTRVAITSLWSGDVRWARNEPALAGDQRNVTVQIARSYVEAQGIAETSRLDDEGLEKAMRWAEAEMRLKDPAVPFRLPPMQFSFATPKVWSDATVGLDAAARGALARTLTAPAAAAGLLSAGYLAVGAKAEAFFDSRGPWGYCARTSAQCSVTVRDGARRGSGWAGGSSHDWATLDAEAIARRAQEKCVASREPVAIEPGRYTVVLEPQAVGDLVEHIVSSLGRELAESGIGPFAYQPGFSKLGQRVVDERLMLSHDPEDPELGICPFDPKGEPYRSVKWIDRGVLTALAYDRDYAVRNINENTPLPNSRSARMSGGDTPIEEMIRTTQRGLLVTRFSNVRITDPNSLLLTGVTRDGLWLIERGKITKPVIHLRFSDSPLAVLNSVEQLGRPVRTFYLDPVDDWEPPPSLDRPTFRANLPMVMPPLKARGFHFTRLVDAV